MHASLTFLRKLDSVYHAALRFVCGADLLIIVYFMTQWHGLSYIIGENCICMFIATALLGKLPLYI